MTTKKTNEEKVRFQDFEGKIIFRGGYRDLLNFKEGDK